MLENGLQVSMIFWHETYHFIEDKYSHFKNKKKNSQLYFHSPQCPKYSLFVMLFIIETQTFKSKLLSLKYLQIMVELPIY